MGGGGRAEGRWIVARTTWLTGAGLRPESHRKRGVIVARLNIPKSIEDAPQESRSTLEQIDKRLGFVPNLHRLMAISPDTLSGFMQLQAALSRTLDARTRDSLALAVSQANGCRYCLCAHSHAAATFNGFSDEEIALARDGKSSHPGRHAAAAFARRLLKRVVTSRTTISRLCAARASTIDRSSNSSLCRSSSCSQTS
jgi:AhpD family alkylhydroperoxidase